MGNRLDCLILVESSIVLFVLLFPRLDTTADHKAQSSTGWKTDVLNVRYLNLKLQSIFMIQVLRNISRKH
jgi:hypothetical protein